MVDRREAVSLILHQLGQGVDKYTRADDGWDSKTQPWHYGRVELRILMDFIYGGPPRDEEEEIPSMRGD